MLYSLLSPFDALNEGTKEKAYPLLAQAQVSTPAVIPMNCHTLIHVLGDRLLI
jgi:hypothetical protein